MSEMDRREKGQQGEAHIRTRMEREGYRLRHQNYRLRGGELDLVLEKDGRIVFIEVKTRSNAAFGGPFDSMTPKKMRHLRRAAAFYLQTYRLEDREVEFWAAAVYLDADGTVTGEEIVKDIYA